MITRTSRHLPIAVILAGLSLLAVESTAQQLHLEAHLLAEPRAVVSTVDISQAQELATIDLVRGDPVSLRIELSNTGTADSVSTGSLGKILSPIKVRVKRPDGTIVVADHDARNIATRAWRNPSPVAPGEVQVLDTFLFEYTVKDEAGHYTPRYLFDSPGQYEVTVTYDIGDPSARLQFEEGLIPEAPPTLVSDPLIIDVLQDQVANWQHLQDAGILSYIGHDRWPALEANNTATQTLIVGAARPWLTEWTNHIVQLSAEPE
jgi:hypothetical protein